MAEALPGRRSILLDSFEGLPDPSDKDREPDDLRADRSAVGEDVARAATLRSGETHLYPLVAPGGLVIIDDSEVRDVRWRTSGIAEPRARRRTGRRGCCRTPPRRHRWAGAPTGEIRRGHNHGRE